MLRLISLLEGFVAIQLPQIDYVEVIAIGALFDDRISFLELLLLHRIDDDSNLAFIESLEHEGLPQPLSNPLNLFCVLAHNFRLEVALAFFCLMDVPSRCTCRRPQH